MTCALALAACPPSDCPPRRARSRNLVPPAPAPFVTPLSLADMTNKQAVVNTSAGAFVIDLRPDLAPNHEFNETKHVKGIVSMARGDHPASATSPFFIVTGNAPSLDGKYTAFGRVVDGMAAVEAIERTPVNGETPVDRIELRGVKLVRTQL